MPTKSISSNETLDEKWLEIACEKCSLAGLCLPVGLSADDIGKLAKIIGKCKTVHKNERLFTQDKPFELLYAVRSGAFKSVRKSEYGQEHIVGFHLPGELIGFEAIHKEQYQFTCSALDTSSVCLIPYDQLLHLSLHFASLNQHLMKILSENLLSQAHTFINDDAHERVAKFILNLSTRFKRIGMSANTFTLPMPRQDIADYLGLANETLSRILKKLQTQGLVIFSKRKVIITDMRKLQISSCKL